MRRGAGVAGAALAAVVIGAVASSCGSSVAQQQGTDVSLVLGMGEGCADRLRAIDLQVQTGSRVDLSSTFTFKPPAPAGGMLSQLPVEVALALPPDPGQTHVAKATFVVDDASGGGTSKSLVDVPIADGTLGRIVILLPCVCIGFACPGGSNCVESPPGSGMAVCVSPPCSDGVKDGSETDVDCGGTCTPCEQGKGCAHGADCASGACAGGMCQAPSCSDGVKNGSETGVDCGGTCPPCGASGACTTGGDCASGVCVAGACQAPTCSDHVQNGSETGVDCGGNTCPACGDGMGCNGDGDCQSGFCSGGTCTAPSCSDGVKNGDETDVDCGGSCPPCGDGQGCNGGGDCQSGVCNGGACVSQCSDGMQDGNETGVDCGGGTCPPCGPGQGCGGDGDCTSGRCWNGTCTSCGPATCALPSTCVDDEFMPAQTATCECGRMDMYYALLTNSNVDLWSCNGAYHLSFAGGVLTLYNASTLASWSPPASGSGTTAVQQDDGNFVIYNTSTPLWSTNTSIGTGDMFHFGLEDTGAMVVVDDTTSKQLWSSPTAGL